MTESEQRNSDGSFAPGNTICLTVPFGPNHPGPVGRGRAKFWTVEKIKPALLRAEGNMIEAARQLSIEYHKPCKYDTVRKMVKHNQELQAAKEEAEWAVADILDHATKKSALAGDQKDRQFYLRSHHAEYRPKQELMGEGGGPILLAPAVKSPAELEIDGIDVDRLERSEQIELSRLCEKINAGARITALDDTELSRFKALLAKGSANDVTPIALSANQ